MSRSFTLIELLIVIAIVAILAVVVILALNPAELLKQARDSNRISDMDTVNRALSLFQVDNPGASFGTASTTYISVGDPGGSASCGNVGISTSTLPSGWSYGCAPTSTYTKNNGTGWIPVNLASISSGSPLSNLPKDPVNTTSTNNYYTYVGTGTNWALSALLESQKYLSQTAAQDGGYDPGRYEKGNSLALVAQSEGLVGWWTFDEGAGATTNDQSGNGNTATLSPTTNWVNGKFGGGLNFNGTNSYVSVSDNVTLDLATSTTVVFWFNAASFPGGQQSVLCKTVSDPNENYRAAVGTNYAYFDYGNANTASGNPTITASSWYQFVGTVTAGGKGRVYINGTEIGSYATQVNAPNPLSTNTNALQIGACPVFDQYLNGTMDDVRVYGRVLTASEIAAIYNATR